MALCVLGGRDLPCLVFRAWVCLHCTGTVRLSCTWQIPSFPLFLPIIIVMPFQPKTSISNSYFPSLLAIMEFPLFMRLCKNLSLSSRSRQVIAPGCSLLGPKKLERGFGERVSSRPRVTRAAAHATNHVYACFLQWFAYTFAEAR